MNPAPVYAQPYGSTLALDCLQRPALRDLDDAEAAMLHILGQREHPFWANVNSDSEGS